MDLKTDERQKLELELVRLDREYYKPPPLADYWDRLSDFSVDRLREMIAKHPSRATLVKGDHIRCPRCSSVWIFLGSMEEINRAPFCGNPCPKRFYPDHEIEVPEHLKGAH